jgi:Domain of unknown function (DUF5655)/Domain of unknown function (DUF4287)
MSEPNSLYSAHPGVKMTQTWVSTLKDRTGRSLDEWLALLKESGPKTEKEQRQWLRQKHQMGMNSAFWIAERAAGKTDETGDPETYLQAAEQYVEKMYSGKKADLRPLYDKLLTLGLSMGKDVKACPCQTMVPLYRRHVFAQIKPATQTRIDMGFALGALKAQGRLVETGGFAKKDRITHRIPISTPADIDGEVKRWLRVAYEGDAE